MASNSAKNKDKDLKLKLYRMGLLHDCTFLSVMTHPQGPPNPHMLINSWQVILVPDRHARAYMLSPIFSEMISYMVLG